MASACSAMFVAEREDENPPRARVSSSSQYEGEQGEAVLTLPSHPHELRWETKERNLCDVCGRKGTDLRCAAGCDFDVCRPCLRSGAGRRRRASSFAVSSVALSIGGARVRLLNLPDDYAAPHEAYRAVPPSMRPNAWVGRSVDAEISLLLVRRQVQQRAANIEDTPDLGIDLWRLPKPTVSTRAVRKFQQQTDIDAASEVTGFRPKVSACFAGLRSMISSLVNDLMRDEYEE